VTALGKNIRLVFTITIVKNRTGETDWHTTSHHLPAAMICLECGNPDPGLEPFWAKISKI